jgi:hypothetical protein
MDTDPFTLSPDAYNAHLLGAVIDATGPPAETAAAKQIRSAVIVEMFRVFEPADAMESMIACHCIALHFLLNAAMRDAGNLDLEPVVLTRMRSSAMSIGKALHLWLSKYEAIHTRNESRAAEARTQVQQTAAAAAVPKPAPAKHAPDHQGRSRPLAPHPLDAIVPDQAPRTRFDAPAMPMKKVLLSSAAVVQGAASNGRQTIATPNRPS